MMVSNTSSDSHASESVPRYSIIDLFKTGNERFPGKGAAESRSAALIHFLSGGQIQMSKLLQVGAGDANVFTS